MVDQCKKIITNRRRMDGRYQWDQDEMYVKKREQIQKQMGGGSQVINEMADSKEVGSDESIDANRGRRRF